MEGQRGICIINFLYFKLIIQEKGLGRQGNMKKQCLILSSLRQLISLAPASSYHRWGPYFYRILRNLLQSWWGLVIRATPLLATCNPHDGVVRHNVKRSLEIIDLQIAAPFHARSSPYGARSV
jgi:hypothetical protein